MVYRGISVSEAKRNETISEMGRGDDRTGDNIYRIWDGMRDVFISFPVVMEQLTLPRMGHISFSCVSYLDIAHFFILLFQFLKHQDDTVFAINTGKLNWLIY